MTRAARWTLALVLVAVAAPAGAETLFRFPGSEEHRQHFYITAYRDLSSSQLQDWACGSTTYGGHRGTDMGAGGFAGMDAGRDVVAGADGVVTYVNDGVFDRCTSGTCGGGGGFGNYVRIEHSDGKESYYGHLKKFSITVSVGDEVSCGQKLGEMGSSGNSTGPHLHFEPRVNNSSDDPFSGPCGGPTSWWVEQGGYQDLPEPVCQDSGGASHPSLAMSSELASSAVDVGEATTARFYVSGSGEIARDVVIGIEGPGDRATILDWRVYDNFADNTCGDTWCPNDANQHPDNPPHELPGGAFDLHVNSLSPDETKMIELSLRADAATGDGGAPLRAWVKEVPGTYEKPEFDSAPNNIDGSQSFNGGDLKQELRLIVDSASGGDGGGGDDPGTPGDPAGPGGPADGGAVAGGCAAAGTAPATGHGLIALALIAVTRRRRTGR